MLGPLDVLIGGIGFIAGAGVAGLALKNKLAALESQLYKEQTKPLCKDCQTSKLLEAREADLAAVAEDRDRIIRSNNQYRGMALRLAEKLRRMTA